MKDEELPCNRQDICRCNHQDIGVLAVIDKKGILLAISSNHWGSWVSLEE